MSKPYAKLERLQPVFVRTVPTPLEHGKIYVSQEFKTSIHLCACGCGEEVVLPFDIVRFPHSHWVLSEQGTFRPSVGNDQYACRSHYYITQWGVDWLAPFGPPRVT